MPRGLTVAADSRRLSQGISNIVVNAIQAMPNGGTLNITGGRTDGRARLLFRDTGRGFSQRALARYAELFFSEKEGGMGIGLNVCAEVVKAHGGSLAVENAREGGAIVAITLPLFA